MNYLQNMLIRKIIGLSALIFYIIIAGGVLYIIDVKHAILSNTQTIVFFLATLYLVSIMFVLLNSDLKNTRK